MKRKTVCIHLGNHKTTAACPRKLPEGGYEVVSLNLANDIDREMSIRIILKNEQMQKLKGHRRPNYELLQELGKIEIGKIISAKASDGEMFCYFKTAPKNFDRLCGNSKNARGCGITHGMLMACFIFSLVNNLLEFNNAGINASERENLDLLVSCPSTSDWTDQDAQEEYAALIRAATKVHDVRIVPESRAAMFISAVNRQEQVSALDSALIFDMGSSTADCIYMLFERKLLGFSWDLGATKIEQQIVHDAYQKGMEERGPFSPSPVSYMKSMIDVRRVKEAYYSGEDNHPIFCCFEDMKDGSDVYTLLKIDEQYMKKVTEEDKFSIRCDSQTIRSGAWKELCRAFFREASRRIGEATYVENIVLTGGASRMDFVYELCQETFPNSHIYRAENPSHTVSNGLAWVAVSDENLPVCKASAL